MKDKLLKKAEIALASAKVLLDLGYADGAVSRAYYAMYDAARAALDARGFQDKAGEYKTHAGLISFFGLHLVKTGIVPAEQGRALNQMNELRAYADYSGDQLSKEKAGVAFQQASDFIGCIKKLVTTATPQKKPGAKNTP